MPQKPNRGFNSRTVANPDRTALFGDCFRIGLFDRNAEVEHRSLDACIGDLVLAEDLLRAVTIDNPFDQTWLE